MNELFDVIIIGSGPAGLTAGIYTSRANLKTLCVAGATWGGQLMKTSVVENFPGFPEGILGPELMEGMRNQAEKFGVRFVDEDVASIDFNERPFTVSTSPDSAESPSPNLGEGRGEVYRANAIIVATGAEFKWLGLPNEQRLIGRGVSACATCDGAFFKDKRVVVVGGGDGAMEEALYLAKFAKEVTIVHRRGEFRASKIMQERVFANSKIKVIWNVEVTDVLGENKVEGVVMSNGQRLEVEGVFVAIGHTPATKIFEGKLNLDPKMYLQRDGEKYHTMTNVAGVFVAGDVHDYRFRQAITAAGYGCEAALEAERWLTEN